MRESKEPWRPIAEELITHVRRLTSADDTRAALALALGDDEANDVVRQMDWLARALEIEMRRSSGSRAATWILGALGTIVISVGSHVAVDAVDGLRDANAKAAQAVECVVVQSEGPTDTATATARGHSRSSGRASATVRPATAEMSAVAADASIPSPAVEVPSLSNQAQVRAPSVAAPGVTGTETDEAHEGAVSNTGQASFTLPATAQAASAIAAAPGEDDVLVDEHGQPLVTETGERLTVPPVEPAP